jgi:hypothetical protein
MRSIPTHKGWMLLLCPHTSPDLQPDPVVGQLLLVMISALCNGWSMIDPATSMQCRVRVMPDQLMLKVEDWSQCEGRKLCLGKVSMPWRSVWCVLD